MTRETFSRTHSMFDSLPAGESVRSRLYFNRVHLKADFVQTISPDCVLTEENTTPGFLHTATAKAHLRGRKKTHYEHNITLTAPLTPLHDRSFKRSGRGG